MIIFSKALADQATVWEALRASESCQNLPPDLLRFSAQKRPVVMWNLTTHCNLACQHCYMDAGHEAREEMSLEEGIHLVDELAEMKVPILIFTGGEPLLSRNFYALAFHAREVGLRTVISTNGTLITPEVARLLAEAQIRYVGVSLDAASAGAHDAFRGVAGAHARALQGHEERSRCRPEDGATHHAHPRQLAGCSGSAQPGSAGEHPSILSLPPCSHGPGGGHGRQGRHARAAAQRYPFAGRGGRGAERREHRNFDHGLAHGWSLSAGAIKGRSQGRERAISC